MPEVMPESTRMSSIASWCERASLGALMNVAAPGRAAALGAGASVPMLCLPASSRSPLPGIGMTPQEQQLLEDFLARVRSASGVAMDPQADALIRERLAGQPDAAYLLVQRALLLEHALENAKAQIAQLQQAAPPPPPAASFLGQGFNAGPPPLPPAPAPQAAPGWRERLFGGGASVPDQAPVAAPAARGPSFLGTAATTAAGVAGGMLLFEGVESLLGSHHGGFLGGGSSQPTVVENVTNNYYDDAPLQDADQDFSDDGSLGGDDNWT